MTGTLVMGVIMLWINKTADKFGRFFSAVEK